jgi:hypothetical protein
MAKRPDKIKYKVELPPKDRVFNARNEPQTDTEVSAHDAQVVLETEYLAKMVEEKFKTYRDSGMFVNYPDPIGKAFYLAIATAIVGFTYMKLDQYHEVTKGLKINV